MRYSNPYAVRSFRSVVGVDETDGVHADGAGAFDIPFDIVDEQRVLRAEIMLIEQAAVDCRIRLQQPDLPETTMPSKAFSSSNRLRARSSLSTEKLVMQ